jgi:hypothetical protein
MIKELLTVIAKRRPCVTRYYETFSSSIECDSAADKVGSAEFLNMAWLASAKSLAGCLLDIFSSFLREATDRRRCDFRQPLPCQLQSAEFRSDEVLFPSEG